uniref:Uncharacterized protein n=1 Tax=Echeneis naucrates TaxID=173247 RepID=A0A665TN03_ECHNA
MEKKSRSSIPPNLLSPLVSTGCSALNLDYFGPEESRSSSSSCSNSPPPGQHVELKKKVDFMNCLSGVDRELYKLTISKWETSANSCHLEDTLNRLMSAAENTSTLIRNPKQDEELSGEADRVIAGLPNLSFMTAKILMFPSVLVP